MAYKLTPDEKRSILVVENFKKTIRNKECEFKAITRWQRGYVLVQNSPPKMKGGSAQGLVADELEILDQDFTDGSTEYSDFSDNMTQIEKDRVLKTSYFDLEDKGWEIDDSEVTLFGPLTVDKVVSKDKSNDAPKNPWEHLLKNL